MQRKQKTEPRRPQSIIHSLRSSWLFSEQRSDPGYRLVVQDNVEESAMDRQTGAIVVDEAEFPELVHEMTDT
jgi:hypothetical protein